VDRRQAGGVALDPQADHAQARCVVGDGRSGEHRRLGDALLDGGLGLQRRGRLAAHHPGGQRVAGGGVDTPLPRSCGPRRSTVTSSQTPKTSRNLCVIMSTEISPAVAIAFRRPSTSSASSGVSTEVGSSRIRKRRLRVELLEDLELLLLAGRTGPRPCGRAAREGRRRHENGQPRPLALPVDDRAQLAIGEGEVLGHRHAGCDRKCWKIMPMPRRAASRWLSMRCSRPSMVRACRCRRRGKPISAFHERPTCPPRFSAEQGVEGAGPDGQRHVLQGLEGTEALAEVQQLDARCAGGLLLRRE